MVHYSSHTIYYEGGAKNPLKGTSTKLVISARNAQFCVLVGRKNIGIYISAKGDFTEDNWLRLTTVTVK